MAHEEFPQAPSAATSCEEAIRGAVGFPFDRELVRFGVCGDNGGVRAALKAKFLAASGVVENVGGLVDRSPVAVGAGQL